MDRVSGGGDASLQAVEPGYRHVLRVRLLLTWSLIVLAAVIFTQTIWREGPYGNLIPAGLAIIGILVVAIAPDRVYRRLRYGLGERLLQVVRGWLFHIDTIVPFVRVQHLDVTRGPLDKMFGTATLIVHTAGTRNSIVTVPGLAPERAAEIRDIIREQIRTDFE